jgi:beta-lactamase regulating signal transducer with metallopeptidase domain
MQALLIEFAVRTALIAAVVAAVLWIMRIKAASARHALWAGVVLVMLVLPAFLSWGPKASLPLLPHEMRAITAGTPLVVTPRSHTPPVQMPTAKPAPREAFVWSWPAFFAGAYLLGLALLLIRLAIGTMRVRTFLRGAEMRNGRLTHASCTTPVTVGWMRPAVILPAGWPEWPQARLDEILAHEREHARRRDPLFQWIALFNRALFWFHPLAWWLERRLSGLAEEACDAAVLAQGHDPRDYSETLLALARSVGRAGARVDVLGMAMPGAFLPARIRRILSGPPAPRVSRARMACMIAICTVMAAIFAAGTLVRAQDKSQPGPVLEVAAVRLNTSGAMQIVQRRNNPTLDQPKVEPVTAGQIAGDTPGTTKYTDRRLLALYFDITAMPAPHWLRALAAAQKFVQTQMSVPDLMCVMEYAGADVKVLNDFTDDHEVLRASLDKLVAEEAQRTGQTDSIFLTDRRLAALQTAVEMLGTLNEKKTVLYFASGLNQNGADNQAQLHATVNAAVRADVSFYPIDSRGLIGSSLFDDATRRSNAGQSPYNVQKSTEK